MQLIQLGCSNLWLDYYICIHVPGSTTTTPETPEPTEDPGSSPTPQMPGIVDNCDEYYKVASGDNCETISKSYGISTAQFKSWNTKVNDGTHASLFSLYAHIAAI